MVFWNLCLVLLSLWTGTCTAQKNVLFIVADDMKPAIGSFQDLDVPFDDLPPFITPNLDKLASRSLLLQRAYCQQAVCSPSRTSFMTGRRPDTTHVWDLIAYWREVSGNLTTIPQYFKDNGYRSIGIGKIFHRANASGFDDPISWSEPYFHGPSKEFYYQKNNSWLALSPEDREALPLPDDQIVEYAIQRLQNISQEPPEERQPFFLALGFYKPHLPFIFPEEFLDYYPEEIMQLPNNPYAPVNMPELAWSNYGELRAYYDVMVLNASGDVNTTLPDYLTLDLRRAYFATVSYVDHLLGTILDALELYGLANDTIISFAGDHGFHLGENGEWCKHTNFEQASRIPMMVSVPGKTDNGIATDALVEFVDLFPTLVEAAGLPQLDLCPENGSSEVELCREGTSLMPLIDSSGNADWKDRVFFQWPKGEGESLEEFVMGYTMRTDRYRYTEWVRFIGIPIYKPDWDDLYAQELYDHFTDPRENVNVVNEPDYADIIDDLHNQLVAGWRDAIVES